MSKIIPFPSEYCREQNEPDTLAHAADMEIIANTVTITLIQQALDDARKSKNWREAKEKINAAIKRGHMHVVK